MTFVSVLLRDSIELVFASCAFPVPVRARNEGEGVARTLCDVIGSKSDDVLPIPLVIPFRSRTSDCVNMAMPGRAKIININKVKCESANWNKLKHCRPFKSDCTKINGAAPY